MIRKQPAERAPYEMQIAALAERQFDVHPEKLPEWLTEADTARRNMLLRQLESLDHLKPPPLQMLPFVVNDVGPRAPPIHLPGQDTGPPIEPGFPTVLSPEPAPIQRPHPSLRSTGRRTALANWIASESNPWTARVIVNRVWRRLMGRGLVETTSDFGRLGQPPSHPELLDWLAKAFIRDGWSLKALHRRILTSATFQQSSRTKDRATAESIDPGNLLLWRATPRRLTAEEIHDAILAASGELGASGRAVFLPVRRNQPHPLLKVFDFPDRIRSAGQRHRTTTSTQALSLWNNPWSHERAQAMRRTLQPRDDRAFVEQAYRRLFAREPQDRELEPALHFLARYAEASQAPAVAPRWVPFPTDEDALALNVSPATVRSIQAGWDRPPLAADFTVEATVMLRSLYENAAVRTIAASWSGNKKEPGWALGVTSTKSAYRPRNLILQLVGSGPDGKTKYEVVASDLRLALDRPYYVAASISLDKGKPAVDFAVQPLFGEGERQIAHKSHGIAGGVHAKRKTATIGGRTGHDWDGLIQRVAVSDQVIAIEDCRATRLHGADTTGRVLWQDYSRGADGYHSANEAPGAAIAWVARQATPRQAARTSLLHALINANETIYVD